MLVLLLVRSTICIEHCWHAANSAVSALLDTSCYWHGFVLQDAPVLSGDAAMDSVFPPTNVVMETGSVLMAVMNVTAVSAELLTQIRITN